MKTEQNLSLSEEESFFQVRLPGIRFRAIAPEHRQVVKRDETRVPWDEAKVTRAIALAFYDVRNNGAANPHRDAPDLRYGLNEEDFRKVRSIAKRVERMLELHYLEGRHPGVEEIQDTVEKAIAAEGEWAIARAYMLYRAKRAEMRLYRHRRNGLGEYIAVSRYARYRSDLQRREVFEEAVDRVVDMHRRRFGDRIMVNFAAILTRLEKEGVIESGIARRIGGFLENKSLLDTIDAAFEGVRRKRVLPSMRSLQFGGKAIEAANARLFNCAYSPADRLEFFREYFYLLLAGVGCGFSVQKHHVEHLPTLPRRAQEMDLPVKYFTVADTIEGWSDALHELVLSYWNGYKVEFNFTGIRRRGSPLRTSGGKAPGHLPLKRALTRAEQILEGSAGRPIKPIEVYDLCMFVARSVLSGGVRRSATICLFSAEDEDMRFAKTGNWFETQPQRSASNNSAVLNRKTAEFEMFRDLFEAQKEFGEPGFYFSEDPEYGCNPCCEIGLHPVVREVDPESARRLRELGYEGDLGSGTRLSGWQMCNLSTINGAAVGGADDFYESCVLAAVIGTVQASYVDMPYLGPITRYLNERESLLGVSICGVMDNPEIFLNPGVLKTGAHICRATNAVLAEAIGIPRAARVTCVKPEGTASLLLGAASGIHPHHAKRYFRRVQANRKDPVYAHFHETNPHMTEPSVYNPDTDDVITFPVEAPEGAVLRSDVNAVSFLEYVRLVQRYWVQEGRAHDFYSPGLHHNVSNTCGVRPEEWDRVAAFIWENRNYFTGIALLGYCGDKAFAQAPNEEVSTQEDIAKWNRLKYRSVDYTSLREQSDETALKDIVACAGGACEL